ncbi:DNA polymerase III subunit gamma/tau [Altererythrobacter salegens]|uniref:DNA polymerase III subunit gamma/tau n=1 Tax=Croceibacterium salegens TaxID=1737568 RepID=A0A6I4SSL8_9SPHN|nr:DNA polymerase III subunit gamma/tau [Croceibacterium salegens]MXO58549.1 DNA polymerase III subunit gamma/tau [Croceibacterium salegens]
MGDSENLFGEDAPPAGEEAEKPTAAELEAAGQSAMFGDPEPKQEEPRIETQPVAVPPPASQPYRVLARKYRPQTFSQLIGQDAMVQTLANAISRDRLAHAFLMTGVRGVGKTSTARLIAKALNCVGPDGQGGPTIDPCGVCEPCKAIAEGRHIDVIEMDAASHTGVDDVREIIEAVRYAAVSARYKIYIIDEVHMLTRNAFNALLKTLEEPPAHVKFLFATTEVDKLPVTVLSRCQRFDLRRIPSDLLQQHYAMVCREEGVEADDEALNMIANAAEGSARDGLSILDQAIAHADLEGGGRITAERVRDMLGLSDRGAMRRLFAAMLEGDPKALIDGVGQQYALGVEPLAIMRGMMDLAHRVTLVQVAKGGADSATADEAAALEGWAQSLPPAQLHRLWQLLLKGYGEVRNAPDPLVAAQMALLRVLHAATLPDPGSLVRKLEEMATNGIAAPSPNTASPAASGPVASIDWRKLVERVEASGALRVAQTMRDWVRVIELAPSRLVFALAPGLPEDPTPEFRDALLRATGERWQVEKGAGEGAPTLREMAEAELASAQARIRSNPLVDAAFAAFPDAEIVEEGEATGVGRNWSKRA